MISKIYVTLRIMIMLNNGMLGMTNKKNSINGEQTQPPAPLGELEQLRQIVFGDAHQQLVNEMTTMQNAFESALKSQEQNFLARLDKMQTNHEQQFLSLEKRINLSDKNHDENEANLQKNISDLASEHEILVTTTQEDFKNITQSLSSESTTLSVQFSEQLEQLKEHLDQVSHELSSSKTDRKTLAKLLATMATNLEDDG